MYTWDKLLSAVLKITKFLKDRKKNDLESTRIFFIDHIEPSYQLLVEIHKDYLKNFNTILKMTEKKARSSQELIDFLKNSRIAYQTEKKRLLQLELEIYNNNAFNKSFSKDTELSKLAVEYIKDIVSYFDNGNYLQTLTWYGHLIEKIGAALDFETKYSENKNAFGITLREKSSNDKKSVENAILLLENRFEWILETYNKLRLHCLK